MRKRNWVLLGVIVLLLAGAGVIRYLTLRQEAEEEASYREEMTAGRRHADRERLEGPDLDRPPMQPQHGILVRELMRQALLMAAREEVGLATRDVTLRESAEQAPDGLRGLGAHAFVRPFQGTQVQLFRDADPSGPPANLAPVPPTRDRQILLQTLIPIQPKEEAEYPALVAKAEAFSRGEFESALGAAGRTGASSGHPTGAGDASASGRLPAEVGRRLGEMNFISQYGAVRAAHGALRSSGGSSHQALGALARGYANLGQLTSYQWTAASKAFAARSLLYAQRMVIQTSDGTAARASALRHRAYAYALSGFQAASLADLDQADRVAPLAQAERAPGWLAVIRPWCRYQPGALAEVAAGSDTDAGLALFLCFLTVERCRSPSVTNGYGQIALKANPDCLRVLDGMIWVSGVSNNHVLTQAGPAILARSIRERTAGMTDLPEGVRQAVRQSGRGELDPAWLAGIAAELVRAGSGDTAEPSWAVLGRLIEEAAFSLVQRRAAFMAESWSVDTSEFLAWARPLFQNHPFRGLIACYDTSRASDEGWKEDLKETAQHLSGQQATYSMDPLYFKLEKAEIKMPSQYGTIWSWQGRFMDYNSIDLECDLTERRTSNWDAEKLQVEALRQVSPHAPIYMAKMIQNEWEGSQPHLAEWKADWGKHPIVSAALGKKYTELKQWKEAEQWLGAYLEKAPDQWAFEMLAGNYLEQGDEAKWLATLKARLEHPDYGLEHSRTNDLIARHYMEQKKWDVARPYAEAGAQSYAHWALETLAECYEGLGERDRAAGVRRAIVERYGKN
jgi:hypothetical protein